MQLTLLQAARAPVMPEPREPAAPSEPDAAVASPPARPTEAQSTEMDAPLAEPENRATAVALSTARLLDRARSSRLTPTLRSGRTLGSAPPRSAAALADGPRSNLGSALARSFAPAAPAIVDRWLAADGSHQVVVQLPNGGTVCGRAEAWDPMRPLIEPVMLFRNCGGGGGRSFTMSSDARPNYTMPD